MEHKYSWLAQNIFGGHYSILHQDSLTENCWTPELFHFHSAQNSDSEIANRIVLTSLKIDSLLTYFYINSFHWLSFITEILCSRVKLLSQWKLFIPSSLTGRGGSINGCLKRLSVHEQNSGSVVRQHEVWSLEGPYSQGSHQITCLVYFVISGYLLSHHSWKS